MDASSKDAHCTVGREAVAWRWRGAEERWYVIAEAPDSTMCEDARLGNIELEPLFAAPSPDSAPGTGAEGMREASDIMVDAAMDEAGSAWGGHIPDRSISRRLMRDALNAALRATLSQPAPGQDVPEPRPAETPPPKFQKDDVGSFSTIRPAGGEEVLRASNLLSLATRLREYVRNPHHINPMSKGFERLIYDAAAALALADRAEPGGREEA